MDDIIPQYNINLKEDFLLIKDEQLEAFMSPDSLPHTHNFYILSFLYEGSINHLSDFENKPVSAPAILMLDIDQVHTHPEIGASKMVSIAFSTDFISSETDYFLAKVSDLFARLYLPVSPTELEELDKIVEMMSKEINREIPNEELIRALLNVTVIQCLAISDNHLVFDNYYQGIFSNFKKLLKKNHHKQHQVKFYADQLNVTTATLNQSIKKSTLKTPKQLIDEQLLLEAKRLLYWSNAPAKEVAWKLGFETDSYFNHFFKKHTGETPKEFQRKKTE